MMWFAGNPVSIFSRTQRLYLPGWLYPDDDILPRYRSVQRVGSLLEFCRGRGVASVGLYRTYALGDILMLLPLARALHRAAGLRRPVKVIVGHRFYRQLAALADPSIEFNAAFGPRSYGCEVHIGLDSVLEADHRGGPASDHHRMDLYAQAMGLALAPGSPA